MANGEALAQTLAGTTSYSLLDGQGSLSALTNSSGSVTDTFRYDAFGNLLSHMDTTTSVYGYDSQRFDAATNLYALRARSYDPTTGRFLARDPATGNSTDPMQLDRYVYAAANPIMRSDPSGRLSVEAAEEEETSVNTITEVLPPPTTPPSGPSLTKYIIAAIVAVAAALSLVGIIENSRGSGSQPAPNPTPTPLPGSQPTRSGPNPTPIATNTRNQPCDYSPLEADYSAPAQGGGTKYAKVRGPERHGGGMCHVNIQVTPPENVPTYNLHVTFDGANYLVNGGPLDPGVPVDPCGPDADCVAWILADRQASLFVTLTKNQSLGNMIVWFHDEAAPRLAALQLMQP